MLRRGSCPAAPSMETNSQFEAYIHRARKDLLMLLLLIETSLEALSPLKGCGEQIGEEVRSPFGDFRMLGSVLPSLVGPASKDLAEGSALVTRLKDEARTCPGGFVDS